MWKQGELSPECGHYCVLALAERFGTDVWGKKNYPVRWVTPEKVDTSKGTKRKHMDRMLQKAKLAATEVSNIDDLVRGDALGLALIRWALPTPAVGERTRDRTWDPEHGHYVVVLEVRQDEIVLADPYPGVPERVYSVERAVFEAAWGLTNNWGRRVSKLAKPQSEILVTARGTARHRGRQRTQAGPLGGRAGATGWLAP